MDWSTSSWNVTSLVTISDVDKSVLCAPFPNKTYLVLPELREIDSAMLLCGALGKIGHSWLELWNLVILKVCVYLRWKASGSPQSGRERCTCEVGRFVWRTLSTEPGRREDILDWSNKLPFNELLVGEYLVTPCFYAKKYNSPAAWPQSVSQTNSDISRFKIALCRLVWLEFM